MAFIKDYEDLKVFKQAFQASLEIHKISLTFPKFEQYDLASQIRKSSKSICANIAEGFYKQSESKLEFKRFLTISIGSCAETRVWLKYCLELGYINTEEFNLLLNNYTEIAKMLSSFRNSIK